MAAREITREEIDDLKKAFYRKKRMVFMERA